MQALSKAWSAVAKFRRDSLVPLWDQFEWPAIGGLAVSAFVLGYLGFESQPAGPGESPSTPDHVYRSLQLFVLEYGSASEPTSWELDAARLLAPTVTFYAAARALAAIFSDELHSLRARSRRNHVVVCGLGLCGALVAREFKRREDEVVAIELDEQNDAIRKGREEGIVVLKGDATDTRMLRKARVDRAAYLVVVCGDDGVNAEVATVARNLVRERSRRPLKCSVQIVDFELRTLLAESALAAHRDETFIPDFFNAAERGAPALLDAHPPFDEEGKTPLGPPHILVVGLGEMGGSVVVHSALRWRQLATTARLPVTVVDFEAEQNAEELRQHYPRLENVCELLLVDKDVRSPAFQRAEFLAGRPRVTIAYVCLGDDASGVSAALALCRLPALRAVPIVVRMTQHAQLAGLVAAEGVGAAHDNLHTFGLLDWVCKPEVLLSGPYEVIAREIHEAHRQDQARAGHASAVDWEHLSDGFKESSRRQAEHIGKKLRAVGCDIARLTDWDAPPVTFSNDEIERMAEMEHERWCQERWGEDWTFGPENDEQRKTSPWLLPWGDLPNEIKEYDRGTVQTITDFLSRVGFTIVRVERGGSP